MTQQHQPPRFLPWVVLGVAELFYIVAIINRTSLSALGPTTQEHFNIGATTLSSFGVLQLVMYAAMQIPVGLLLDRFGVRNVVLIGGATMALGQFAMAFSEQVWFAVFARMLVGAGDAFVFISVMRLLPEWFPAHQLPMLGQLVGILGSSGQIVSLFPLSLAVGALGWTAGFAGAAAVGLLVVLLGAVTLRNTPGGYTALESLKRKRGRLSERAELLLEDGSIGMASMPANTGLINLPKTRARTKAGKFSENFRVILSIPGVRLAFWVHFTAPFSQHIVLLLWGTPLLVGGVGMSQAEASTVLTSMLFVGVLAGLSFGRATSRYTRYRVYIVMGAVVAIMLAWALFLLWPQTPPLWTVLMMATITAFGGAASMVSFEVVRSYSPRRFIGFSTGTVNMGGFIAALIGMALIGVVLDLQGAGSPETYSLTAFRWAFATQYALWIPGFVFLMVELKRTRQWMREHGGN